MKVLIVGTGAVGGVFGAKLLQAGVPTEFLARGETLKVLREKGLTLEISGSTKTFPVSKSSSDIKDFSDVSIFLVAVKSFQIENIFQQISPLIQSHQLVVPLANGMESVELGPKYFKANNFANGYCGVVSRMIAPGHIFLKDDKSFLRFQSKDEHKNQLLQKLSEKFQSVGVDASVSEYCLESQWRKFIFISTWSLMGLQTGMSIGPWREASLLREKASQLLEEIIALCQKKGFRPEPNEVADFLAWFDRVNASATTSLQDDMNNGKKSEADSLLFVFQKWTNEVGDVYPHLNTALSEIEEKFKISPSNLMLKS